MLLCIIHFICILGPIFPLAPHHHYKLFSQMRVIKTATMKVVCMYIVYVYIQVRK